MKLRRLGISQSNVPRWVREFRKDQHDGAEGEISCKELEAEVKRLKKENQRLQMERDLKATAFFAKESNFDTTSFGSK